MNNIGEVYRKMNDYEKAINSYKKALSIKHDYLEAHANLGNVYIRLGA